MACSRCGWDEPRGQPLTMTFDWYEEAFPGRFSGAKTPYPIQKVPAHSLPFWNLLVMMKPHSLELHSVKNRFRGSGSH